MMTETMKTKTGADASPSAGLKPYFLMSRINSTPAPWLFLAATIWFVLEFVWMGRYSPFIAGDNVSFIPYYLAFTESGLAFGNWTPFPAGGTDFAATGYATAFFRWVFSALPSWAAIQVLIYVPIAAALLGTYGICRKTVKLDKVPSAFAAFAYGSMFFGHLFFLTAPLAYIPAIIYVLGNLLDQKSSGKWWLLTLLAVFLIAQSSVFPRLVPWPGAVIVIWFLILERRCKWSDWIIISLVCIGMMALRAQDFIAIASHIQLSSLPDHRPPGDFKSVMATAFTTVYGHIFGKYFFSTVLLSLFGVFLYRSRSPIGYRILGALGTIVFLLFAASLAKILLSEILPGFNTFNITRIMQGFSLLSIIAGGFAFQYLLQAVPGRGGNSPVPIWLYRILPLALFLMVIGLNLETKFHHVRDWVTWGNVIQNSRSPDLLALAGKIRSGESPSRAMSFHMHESLLNSYGIETIGGYHPLTSKRYFEFWHELSKPYHTAPDWVATHGSIRGGMTSILPGTVSFLGDQKTDLSTRWDLDKFVNMNLLSLVDGGFIVSRDKLSGTGIELVSGPDRSWSALSQMEKIKTNIRANFTARRHHYIYRNANVFPRAFSVNTVKVFSSDPEVLGGLGGADLETLKRTLFVNRNSLPASVGDSISRLKQVKILSQRFQGDQLRIDIQPSDNPSILIVMNSYSPYWQAEVDGVSADMFPANHAFWGVFVPPGSQTVKFSYQPPYAY